MKSQTTKTGMITRTSILILCAALLGAASFGLGPAGMRVYLLLAGVLGMIAFFGLDYISRKSGNTAETTADKAVSQQITERMQQHTGRTAASKEEKAKATV